ncbi:MAG TPA: Clp protease N-terminal domain-containing protein, partial [Telluria sp.]|nr:Clp protease N-terminal domain-containing protein [Telluria sp.]
MLGSTVLEVAIGLTFCYGTVALIVTTLQEALASVFRLRANTLLAGVKSMLNDPNFNALAQAVYGHPLVNPHDDGAAGDERALKHKPSYIEPIHFAIALVDSIQKTGGDYASLKAAIEAVPDPQLRRALTGLYQRAADLQQFQQLVAGWFDNAMERMSGVYKRKQLLVSFLLSLLLAIMFNIDSIHLFRTLWQHPTLAAHINGAPGMLDEATIQALWALPIGWTTPFPPQLNAAFA